MVEVKWKKERKMLFMPEKVKKTSKLIEVRTDSKVNISKKVERKLFN